VTGGIVLESSVTTTEDWIKARKGMLPVGFRHEGTMIESWCEGAEGAWSDEVLYALLEREWALHEAVACPV
jgi:hypothetical protein